MKDPMQTAELTCSIEQAATTIAENWNRVRDEIAQAARDASRVPDEVRIVGVTKYVNAEITSLIVDAGCHALGENRPQMMTQKTQWFTEHRPDVADQITWHQIGHLQRNKVRRLLASHPMIHSVDSERLLVEIDAEALRQSVSIDVLMEINVSEESAKTGLPANELAGILDRFESREREASGVHGVRIIGLMAMAGWGTEPDQARPQFARLRELRDEMRSKTELELPELSMGMSGDYEAAIAEGATTVRIGSSLFQGVLP